MKTKMTDNDRENQIVILSREIETITGHKPEDLARLGELASMLRHVRNGGDAADYLNRDKEITALREEISGITGCTPADLRRSGDLTARLRELRESRWAGEANSN